MPKPNKKSQSKTKQKKEQFKQDKHDQKVLRKRQRYQRGVAKSLRGYTKHLQEFQEEVKAFGLMIRDVEGDGNCLFRSISDIVDGTERNHFKYRNLAVDYLDEHREFYELFIEDDITFDQYLKDMRSDGEWGGHHELQALTNVLKANFIIHMKGKPAMIINSMSDGMSRVTSLKQKPTFHLAYHLVEDIAEHYSSIRLDDDDFTRPAKQIPLESLGIDLETIKDYSLSDPEEESNETIIEKTNSNDEEEDQEETVQVQQMEQGRNKKCFCGSKRPYKKCCGQKKPAKPKATVSQVVFI